MLLGSVRMVVCVQGVSSIVVCVQGVSMVAYVSKESWGPKSTWAIRSAQLACTQKWDPSLL